MFGFCAAPFPEGQTGPALGLARAAGLAALAGRLLQPCVQTVCQPPWLLLGYIGSPGGAGWGVVGRGGLGQTGCQPLGCFWVTEASGVGWGGLGGNNGFRV